MRKKTDTQATIVDPAYWHLMPEKERLKAQKELEDELEAALDEGSVDADDKYWEEFRIRALKRAIAREGAIGLPVC